MISQRLTAKLALFTDLVAVLVADELMVRWVTGPLLEWWLLAGWHTRYTRRELL
jgi:hypothetical protein